MALAQEKIYTIDDIYALPDGQRAELIDGQIYMMTPPNRIHQQLSHFLEWEIENYIQRKKGECEVYAAPFAVFLNKDDHNYIEPDISVICDKNKLDDRGCNGSPDWVIEITSPSDPQRDYGILINIVLMMKSLFASIQTWLFALQIYYLRQIDDKITCSKSKEIKPPHF